MLAARWGIREFRLRTLQTFASFAVQNFRFFDSLNPRFFTLGGLPAGAAFTCGATSWSGLAPPPLRSIPLRGKVFLGCLSQSNQNQPPLRSARLVFSRCSTAPTSLNQSAQREARSPAQRMRARPGGGGRHDQSTRRRGPQGRWRGAPQPVSAPNEYPL
jgi:hypothetical protein